MGVPLTLEKFKIPATSNPGHLKKFNGIQYLEQFFRLTRPSHIEAIVQRSHCRFDYYTAITLLFSSPPPHADHSQVIMDQNNGTGDAQPNGHENGIKRPHEGGLEIENIDQEPDVKRVRVDETNNGDKDVSQSDVKMTTDESKANGKASQIEVEAQVEVSDSRAVPRGTAVIKPE